MNKEVTHREYFAQFALPHVLKLVESRIGLPMLLASKDPHLNDIPLVMWDRIWRRDAPGKGMWIEPGLTISALLKESGEGNSAATGVCILKEAARQIIESHKVTA